MHSMVNDTLHLLHSYQRARPHHAGILSHCIWVEPLLLNTIFVIVQSIIH